jgi:hypothetical protein
MTPLVEVFERAVRDRAPRGHARVLTANEACRSSLVEIKLGAS